MIEGIVKIKRSVTRFPTGEESLDEDLKIGRLLNEEELKEIEHAVKLLDGKFSTDPDLDFKPDQKSWYQQIFIRIPKVYLSGCLRVLNRLANSFITPYLLGAFVYDAYNKRDNAYNEKGVLIRRYLATNERHQPDQRLERIRDIIRDLYLRTNFKSI